MANKWLRKGILLLATVCIAAGLMTGTGMQTVYATETQQTAVSSDSTLKTLNISTGTISPDFTPEITQYTITVGEDVEKVNVTCSTSAADAKVVEAGGFKDLQPGSNEAAITVQAADGSKTTYKLTIMRGEASGTSGETTGEPVKEPEDNPAQTDETEHTELETEVPGNVEAGIFGEAVTTSVTVDNPIDPNAEFIPVGGDTIYSAFQVHTTFPAELMPSGFVMENYTYKGVNVQSAYYAMGNIRLLYLNAVDGGSADFRIYYEDTDVFMDFVRFEGTDGKFIIPVRYAGQSKIPDNYTGSYLPWSDKVVSCYIYTELTGNPIKVPEEMADMEGTTTEDTSEAEPVKVEDLDEEVEFYLIYAMNNQGEEGFYLYDIVEDTYQRYVERDTSYDLDQSYFKYKDMAHRRFGILCVLAVLLVIAGFTIVNLVLQNRDLKLELDEDEDEEDDNEEDDEIEEEDEKKPLKKKPVEKNVAEKKPAEKKPAEKKVVEKKPVEKKPAEKKLVEKKPAEKKTVEKKPMDKKRVEQAPAEQKPAKKETDEANDDMTLEEKIISQLQMNTKEPEMIEKEAPRPRKNSSFKMINLSREPEPTGLDDDFEFEFINLEDE